MIVESDVSVLRKLSDGAVSQIVESEPRQVRFLRQGPPGRPPALHVPRRIKASDVVVHHSLAAECEFWNEGSKDYSGTAQPCQIPPPFGGALHERR